MNTTRHILILAITFCCFNSGLFAQVSGDTEYSFEFRGELLNEALDKIARVTEIDLVYDPLLVQGHHVYKRLQNKHIRSVLSELLNEFQLDYLTLSSGTVVIVRSVAEGPFYGTFSGKITDSRTGEPLSGATILLADASGGTSTNRTGNFSLNRLMTGKHVITFSYIGYEPVSKTIEIFPNEQHREQIALNPKPVDISPIVVEAHRPRMPYQNHSESTEINPGQISGMMYEPIRSLNLVPGIQYGLPMTDLHLQGGQRGEHRILLDGVPVYNPYTFGQLFSSFSPFAIGNIDLYKAGYGVKQGSQIAGLIDLSHDYVSTGNNSVMFYADPLSLNFRGDLSVPFNESALNIMTALRTNYWNVYKDPKLEQTLKNWDVLDPLITNLMTDINIDASRYQPVFQESDVQFFDYHLAASYEIDPFSTLSGSFYLAENYVETLLMNQNFYPQINAPYLNSNDSYDWQNLMARISWDQMVTPRFDLSLQASYSSNRFEHQNRIGTSSLPNITGSALNEYAASYDSFTRSSLLLPTKVDGNNIQHFISRADGSYNFSPRFSIQAGLQADIISSGLEFAELVENSIQTDQRSALLGTYFNSSHTFGNFWTFDWGSRFTYASQPGSIFAEPRISVQYDKPDSEIGYWSARISGGLYRQFVNEFQITNSSPTSVVPSFSIWSHAGDLDIPKAWHLNGSFLLEPAEHTSIKLEAFYKWQPVTNITSYGRPVESSDTDNKISAFAESTSMTALGGGIRFNQSLANSKLKLLAGYDYSFSQIDLASQFGRTMPAPWNEPHSARIRAMWHILPNLTMVSKWQGIWGRTWAFRQSYYDFLRFDDETNLPFSFDSPDTDTLKPFHQVDLSFIYKPVVGPADIELRLELINLLNRTNTLDRYLMPVFGTGDQISYERRNREFPGFYPSVSLGVVF